MYLTLAPTLLPPYKTRNLGASAFPCINLLIAWGCAPKLDPTNPAPYLNLSLVLQQKGDVARAIELMEQFVRRGGNPGVDGEGRLNYLRGLL